MAATLRAAVSWALLVVMIGGLAGGRAQAGYVLADLGTLPGGPNSVGTAINDAGVVVGWALNDHAMPNAVKYAGGSLGDLGTLGGYKSFAYGISVEGQITGSSDVPDPLHPNKYLPHAFITAPNSTILMDLGTLRGMNSSEGLGINASGNVVGDSSSKFTTHAFRSNHDGTLSDLGTLAGGNYSRGNAINNQNDVAGTSSTLWGPYHAFLYTDKTGMRDLGTLLGGTSSFGLAINTFDRVAGRADNSLGDFHAFVTGHDGRLMDLGTLKGGTSSEALGINDGGLVVGSSLVDGDQTHGFLWDSRTGMVDLNTLIDPKSGWVITEADAINATGQITGTGFFHGQTHGFVLTPSGGFFHVTPEPSSVALLLGAGICFALWRCANRR
jgi:probable HAF family extracellular repeat protein